MVRRFHMNDKYAGYYYSDEKQEGSLLRSFAVLAGLGLGGWAAYRTGLLRPVLQRAMVLGSRWRPGVFQDISHGIYTWARDTREISFTRALRDLPAYVLSSVRGRWTSHRVPPLALETALESAEEILEKMRVQWTYETAVQGMGPETINRVVSRGLGVLTELFSETVAREFRVTPELQSAMLRRLGVRFATAADIAALEGAARRPFSELQLLLQRYGLSSAQDIILDPRLFVHGTTGQLIDMRHLAGRMSTWLRAFERHFAIPFAGFNPVSMFHLSELLRLERWPTIQLLEAGEIQPFLTGTIEPIERAVFAGGKVYKLSSIPRRLADLEVMNEGRRGYLMPGRANFIAMEYLRSMAGLPIRRYKPYRQGVRGMYARLMQSARLGFQDVYQWTDEELGLLREEAGISSINEIQNRIINALMRRFRPWASAEPVLETRQFINQPWIYMNAADIESLASVARQLGAGRHNLSGVSTLTLFPYIGMSRMNVALGAAGMGLPVESTGSAVEIFRDMFLRRAFILGALAFTWHYLNYEAENITGIRPEYVMADFYVRATEELSGLGEKVGLPSFVRCLGQLLPGGEQISELPLIRPMTQWMGKTREEMEEYWEHGEEPVRKGRYWSLGSTPFTGGRVIQHIPNWYRRLKSKWQYTDVLYGSEDEYFAYALFPTPRFPAAPLRRYILDPYHFERRHYYDRPYLLTGDIPELVELPIVGPLLTSVSRLIKPQLRMHPEVWQLIESGIIPQSGAAQEIYIPPERLEKGRPAPKDKYLQPEEADIAALLSSPETAEALDRLYQAYGEGEYPPGLWGLKATGALHAWRAAEKGQDVVVAVIDTGVDRRHPDLRGQILEGYNVIEGNRDVADRLGHGTHVAGIIAALGNNGRGAAGAAFPAVKILPIKALSDQGTARPEDIDKAIEYAVNWRGPGGERVSVINLSLGAPGILPIHSEAIKRAYEAGITVVAAAGNEATWRSDTPAIWPEGLSVAAAEEGEKGEIERAPYSNYGLGVDITAPGSGILSTVPGGERYDVMSGTSMAAPYVAATAALLKAARPDLTPDEIRYLITRTAQDLGPAGADKIYGAGLVDIGYAVAVAEDLTDEERKQLAEQAEIEGRNIDAQRFLLLNYMRNRLGNDIIGLINRGISDQYGRRAVQPGSIEEIAARFWGSVTEMLGFYGFTMETLTGTDEAARRSEYVRMADARAITSLRRRFWSNEFGGLGGDVNEILRRFIGKRERWEWMWNPVPNLVMPSWLPGPEYTLVDFHTGDVYSKVPFGEMLLPGGGYEALWHVPAAELIKRDPILSEMEKAGLINRFEFYDPLNRFRVLAHVAPWSEEYKYYSKLMSQMKLTPEEQEEVKRIRKQVRERKKPLRLYPYRFHYLNLKTETVTVEKVIDQNTILVREYPEHPVRFAGIYVTQAKDKAASAEAMQWLQEHLKPGTRIAITYDPEHMYAEDTYETIRAAVWLGRLNVGRAMLLRGWATEKENDYSAPAVLTRFSWQERLVGRLWEIIAHLDTPVNTKLLQTRSAYEDWIRREVYGKNYQQWQHPVRDYIMPTYEPFIARSPLIAAASGAVLGALFGRTRYGMAIGAIIGGAVVGAGSLYRVLYETITGEKWIPERRRREWELEQYLDILKYIKYRRLFEYEARKAWKEEHLNVFAYIDALRQEKEARKARIEDLLEAKRLLYRSAGDVDLNRLIEEYNIILLPEEEGEQELDKRERLVRRIRRSINAELELLQQAPPDRTAELPPHARRALQYYRLMKQTMYGYEPGEPLQNYLAALPKKERRYFPYFLKMPEEEYEKLKEVAPDWLLWGLAPMRGEAPPEKPDLREYFEHHFLPDESWPGWLPNVSLSDVRVKLVQHEGMDEYEFDIWPEDEARARSSPVPAPRAFRPAEHGHKLDEKLRRLLSGQGITDLDIIMEPADRDLNIDVDLNVDPTDELVDIINRDPALLLSN